MRILGVIGSLRDESHTAHLVTYVLNAAKQAGLSTSTLLPHDVRIYERVVPA